MIKTEEVTIRNRSFTRTWSSRNRYIVRDDVNYIEALDLTELGRTYKEGDPIPEEEEDGESEE